MSWFILQQGVVCYHKLQNLMKVLTDYLTTHLLLHTVCNVDWSVGVKEPTVNYVRRTL